MYLEQVLNMLSLIRSSDTFDRFSIFDQMKSYPKISSAYRNIFCSMKSTLLVQL